MRKLLVIFSMLVTIAVCVSFSGNSLDLRKIYSQSPDKWPAPAVDRGVEWTELAPLPPSPLEGQLDSLKHLINLGKTLFFDPRLSGSGTTSCATCHQPELSWADGKKQSINHRGVVNKRNAPTIQNTWYYKKLFWDGRARDLEDQAFAPINSESEMEGDMSELPRKLRRIKGYAALFDSAYGDPGIDPDRIAGAMAVFEKTVVSQPSKFDQFLSGDKNAMNEQELRGLHLFRTKAKCMNCHHGPMLTDNQFHVTVFSNTGAGRADKGHFNATRKEEDLYRFRTPSLRDVMYTGPWMHNGSMENMEEILVLYNRRSPSPFHNGKTTMLFLTKREIADILAFLQAVSAPPLPFEKPALPE